MPTSARCDDLEALKKKGCHPDDIENPRGSKDIKKNKNVTNRSKGTAEKLKPEDITQIQPQQLVLQLRSGKTSNSVISLFLLELFTTTLYNPHQFLLRVHFHMWTGSQVESGIHFRHVFLDITICNT